MNTYNGWHNFATWKINLEIFDGMELGDFWADVEDSDAYEIGEMLRQYAEELIESQSEGLALDYALAFISDVSWIDIAQSLIDNANEE